MMFFLAAYLLGNPTAPAFCSPSQYTLCMKHSKALPSLNTHGTVAALRLRETVERQMVLNLAYVLFN